LALWLFGLFALFVQSLLLVNTAQRGERIDKEEFRVFHEELAYPMVGKAS
jgi:hypothetical protein